MQYFEQMRIKMMNLDNIVKSSKKKVKIVGVDVDNVLFRIPTIEYINDLFGTKYTYEDMNDWTFSNFPKEIQDEVFHAFRSTDFMCRTKPYWGNYCTLRDWKLEGHKIFAITRRAYNLYNKTEQQILNHFPNIFQDMIFVKPNESKAKFLRNLDEDIHIDDYDVEDSVMAGITTWLITNEETKYNHYLRNNLGLNQADCLQNVKGVSRKDDKWLV